MSDTPRTDALRYELEDRYSFGTWTEVIPFASALERELNEARAEAERLREALEAMLSHTADLDPMQGYRPEEDFSAVKQARTALARKETT